MSSLALTPGRTVTPVALVDDDPRVLRAMSALIDSDDRYTVVQALANREEALNWSGTADVVVVVDAMLPSLRAGLHLIHELTGRGHAVLATSVSGSARDGALAAGAVGFVEKGSDPQALMSALAGAAPE